MPTAHYDLTITTDKALEAKLVLLGCLNPRLTLKKAANHAVGHSVESLHALLDYCLSRGVESPTVMRHGTLVHEPTMIYPWGGGAINNRITNPDLALLKPHDGWPSVDGNWQSLKNQRDTPGLPGGKKPLATPTGPVAAPNAYAGRACSPEDEMQAQARYADLEARYGARINALTKLEAVSLLQGFLYHKSSLDLWESGPPPKSLRVALKLALESREAVTL